VSGSPIIQDGKLVGAVTHVLVNDHTQEYRIFTENMPDSQKQPDNKYHRQQQNECCKTLSLMTSVLNQQPDPSKTCTTESEDSCISKPS